MTDSITQSWTTVAAPSSLPRVGSAGLIVDQRGRLLFGRRSKEPNFGKWVLPGGKIEPYETIARALSREVEEETGLRVVVGERAGVFEILREGQEHRIVIYSWARPVAGQLRPSSDLSEALFASREEAATLDLSEFTRDVLSAVHWADGSRATAGWGPTARHRRRKRTSLARYELESEFGF